MKYIGIRGRRGSGKKTIAYLLAKTIDYIVSDYPYDNFQHNFNDWCDKIINDENEISRINCKHVIVESFGDTPKMLLQMLTGIPMIDMCTDYTKDHIIINLRTFETTEIENVEKFPCKLWTADEKFKYTEFSTDPTPIEEDIYMTLREFILYFGIYIMQNAFGLNIWIKSLNANKEYFSGLFPDDLSGYKIFRDIKARSEVSYIKDHDGIVVKISRPSYIKSGGMNLLRGDSRYDYDIINDGDLKNIWEQVYNIAKKIIDNDNI